MADETPEVPAGQRSCARWMVAALLLLIVVAGLVSLRKLGTVGARVAALKAKIAAAQEALPSPERAPVWRTVDPKGGNAADHYAVVEWVCQPRSDWDKSRPPHGIADRLQPGFGFDTHDMPKMLHKVDVGQAFTAQEEAEIQQVLPLLKHIRAGLRSPRCDWKVKVGDGLNSVLPNLLVIRQATQLLAVEADRAKTPEAALQAGLDALALARDIGMHPAPIMQAIVIGNEAIAARSLARTLTRHAVSAADCRRLIALSLSAPDLGVLLRHETLAQECLLAEFAGHPQGRATPGIDAQPVAKIGPKLVAMWFWNDDLLDVHETIVGLAAKPRPWRGAEALDKRFNERLTGVSRLFIGAWEGMLDYPAQLQVFRGAIRLFAAARLVRIETGKLPTTAADCAKHLGGELPRDPFAEGEAPLKLGIVQGELRVWSVGRDGLDEQGALKRDTFKPSKVKTQVPSGSVGDDPVVAAVRATTPAQAPASVPSKTR